MPGPTRPCRLRRVAALVTIVIASASCGSGPADQRTEVVGIGDSAFPDTELRDWVSYADAVAVFDVVAETALPDEPSVKAHREGYVGRSVRVQVRRTLWSAAPGPGTTPLPAGFDIETLGWIRRGDRPIPFRFHGGPRPEVGSRYLAPFFHGARGWGVLSYPSVFPSSAEDRLGPSDGPLHESWAGRTIDEFADALIRTAADPTAAAARHLAPEIRVAAVRETSKTSTSSKNETKKP